ncbi:MAG TPA: FecR domain-containing protein [Cyclobacteriaceae bacterium]|nr:FecR domain-containing protein [Cyclobacteriaceae bacterium]
MEHLPDDIDDLIGKVLAGEASQEEKMRLEQWAQQDPGNRAYVAGLRTIFERAGSTGVQHQFDTDAAWLKVKRQLRHDNQRFLLTPRRIAAAIATLIGVGLILFQMNKTQPAAIVRAEQQVVHDTLPDGSKTILNKNTTLAYTYDSRKKMRIVKLSGESFFEVKHEVDRHFVIEAADLRIEDIGTSFNVKAYPGSDTVEVAVQEGEVHMYIPGQDGLHLVAGEAAIYTHSEHLFSRLEKADTNVLAYKTGILSFRNTYLKSIVDKINDLYDARIRLDNPDIASCRMTVNFHGENVDTMVDIIAETLNLTVARKQGEIILSGIGCP